MENKNCTLVFDTCLDKMYIALKKDGMILESRVVENTKSQYHSAFLISTITDILNSHKLKPEDVSLLGINIGPGSFTGIRACTTVARVFAQQTNCKAVGISSLEILSKIIKCNNPLVALDARKNMAYLYTNREIKGAIPIDEVKTMVDNSNYTVITDDKLQPLFGGISYQQNSYPLGEILLELTEEKNSTSDGDWRKVLPLYIQPPPMGC